MIPLVFPFHFPESLQHFSFPFPQNSYYWLRRTRIQEYQSPCGLAFCNLGSNQILTFLAFSSGLEEQGLYRVVGVASKVTKLLTHGLDRRKSDKLSLDDRLEWESKTITSAIKTFFRNLPEPIMTFKLHHQFIAAASE